VFCGLFFGLGLESQFAEVLHHRVWIDPANRANFFFRLEFALAFTEQAAGDVADGAEPAFALDFLFQFFFAFSLEFLFELFF
jgi:hypothetical protein